VRDPLYIAARRVLLDALDAARDHLGALTLVGAQAVYVHANEADLAVAPYTIDGDIAIDPRVLGAAPPLDRVLNAAGFVAREGAVGTWQRSVSVEAVTRLISVDLLVPESLGGPGRRAARTPPHGVAIARKVSGLEGVLVDREPFAFTSFEHDDDRSFEIAVAGPAALIVAKVFKILDRAADADRLRDKDALDVYRLLRAVPTDELATRFATLRAASMSAPVTERAIAELSLLFGTQQSDGCAMAVRSAGDFEAGETLAAAFAALTQDLVRKVAR